MKKQTHHEEITAAVEVGTAAGVAAATSGQVLTAGSAAGIAVLPALFGLVLGKALRWKEAEASRFWETLLDGKEPDGVTREEIAGRVEAHSEEPFVRETILRSVRTVVDAVDPCVIVPLAVLARQCIREKVRPDAFTRHTMRLLTELGPTELSDLTLMLRWILEMTGQEYVTVTCRNQKQVSGNAWEPIPWEAELLRDEYVGTSTNAPDRYAKLVGTEDPSRVVFLLRTNGLAQEKGGMSLAAGPYSMVIERKVAQRLYEIIRLAV